MDNSNLDTLSNGRKWQGRAINTTSSAAHNSPPTNQHLNSSVYSPPQISSSEKPLVPLRIGFSEFTCLNPTLHKPFDSLVLGKENVATRKRFLIFDQSGDCTRLIFSSLQPPILNAKLFAQESKYERHPDSHRTAADCQRCSRTCRSQETAVSDGSEIPEDSNEIDALLYSDSEHNDLELVKPSGSNGVASSGMPAKRQRLNSARIESIPHPCHDHAGEEASCVKGASGDGSNEGSLSMFGNHGACNKRKRIRNQIVKTVGVLRRIIPGGKGKDAAMVLDKAIQYLRSLQLKVPQSGSQSSWSCAVASESEG